MQGTSRGTASRYQCSCLLKPRTTFSPVHLSAGTRQAAGTLSADQFGEQMAIKIGKGGLNGFTLSSTQVAEWIDSFPISACF